MKVFQILFLILGLTVFVNAQKAILSGNVYDANGALIVGAEVKAVNEKGEKLETLTNDEGIYTLNLPFSTYNSKDDFKVSKYDITVEQKHFEKLFLEGFKFVPSYKGKMNLDLALDVAQNTNCGAGGCIQIQAEPITNVSDQKLSDKVLQRPAEKLPKEQNKNKRKN